MAMVECFAAFTYWNPVRAQYVGVPEGMEVRLVDRDAVSADDVLGSARTRGTDGEVSLRVSKEDEEAPDLYLELVTGGAWIDLESNRLVALDGLATRGRYLKLPDVWTSQGRYTRDYRRGLEERFPGERWGTPERPLLFRLALDCFVRFVYWNEVRRAYVGLPEGIEVELVDRQGALQADRVLATGQTKADGSFYLTAFLPDGDTPDVYFRYRVPDGRHPWIDLATNTLRSPPSFDAPAAPPADRPLGARAVRSTEGALEIPRTWSTRESYALEDVEQKGYWDDFFGTRIGRPESPYVFDVLQGPAQLTAGNHVEALIDGEAALTAIERAVRAAQRSVHVAVMLFFDDPIGRRLADLLIEKARQGVEVRVMFDAGTTGGSATLLELKRFWVSQLIVLKDEVRAKLLAQLERDIAAEKVRADTSKLAARLHATPGVRCLDTNFPRVQIFNSTSDKVPPAYREIAGPPVGFTVARVDHRKIVIADGKVAFVGGMNVGGEYLFRRPFDPLKEAVAEANAGGEEPWVKWHDCFAELRGPAVRELQKLFRERWVSEGGDAFDFGPRDLGAGTDPSHPYFPRLDPSPGGMDVKIASTTPGARFQIHDEYLSLIDRARREILIENPYFSSGELKEHLVRAVDRGVKVRVILPDDHNDSCEFLYGARLAYGALIARGVEIYEYRNHMTHAKVAVIDGEVAIIGSANLNHTSFFNHYEVCAIVRDKRFAADFRTRMFERDLAHARRITPADLPALCSVYPAAELFIRSVVHTLF